MNSVNDLCNWRSSWERGVCDTKVWKTCFVTILLAITGVFQKSNVLQNIFSLVLIRSLFFKKKWQCYRRLILDLISIKNFRPFFHCIIDWVWAIKKRGEKICYLGGVVQLKIDIRYVFDASYFIGKHSENRPIRIRYSIRKLDFYLFLWHLTNFWRFEPKRISRIVKDFESWIMMVS